MSQIIELQTTDRGLMTCDAKIHFEIELDLKELQRQEIMLADSAQSRHRRPRLFLYSFALCAK